TALMFSAMTSAVARGAVADQRTSPWVVHEPTELAWIIAALSAIGRAGGGVIRRDTSYFADLAHWFAPVADHQLVTKLGAYFNLPRFVGNSEDYQFAS
ncbi:hypothetical protein ACTGUZ_11320, partial [Streptococcus suis]